MTTSGSTTQFGCDGRGNRLSVTRAGAEILYVYDPWDNLLATWDGTAGFRKYVYGRGLVALQVGAARYCYHFNPTGGTVALTDMSGSVVNSYAYDPFGVMLARNEQVAQPFQFVGQYGVMAEPEGLYYMRARYYDPNVGRFISEDPLGFGGGDVNLFAYVSNDPVNRADPSGMTEGWHTLNTLAQKMMDAGYTPEQIIDAIRPLRGGTAMNATIIEGSALATGAITVAAVFGSAAVGYGIGTVIDKGITYFLGKPLGYAVFDLLHPEANDLLTRPSLPCK